MECHSNISVTRPLARGVERQLFGASALCSNPLAEEENCFLRQLALVLLAILKALAPSSFEYMCLVVISL